MLSTSLICVLSSQMKPEFPHGLVRMSFCCMLVYLFFKMLVVMRKTYAGSYPPIPISLSSVSFMDCGRGSSLRFESGYPEDFRIGEDGTVYAKRTLRVSDRKGWSLEIHAKDKVTQEVWLTQVIFALPDTPKQVSLSLNCHFHTISVIRKP